MPLFTVRFEDMGFMEKCDLFGSELSREFIDGFNDQTKLENGFPKGVIGLQGAYASPDENQGSDMKFFVPVTLIIEASSLDDAERFNPPVDFLSKIADAITEISGSDLEGSWEFMEADTYEDPEVVQVVESEVSKKKRVTP